MRAKVQTRTHNQGFYYFLIVSILFFTIYISYNISVIYKDELTSLISSSYSANSERAEKNFLDKGKDMVNKALIKDSINILKYTPMEDKLFNIDIKSEFLKNTITGVVPILNYKASQEKEKGNNKSGGKVVENEEDKLNVDQESLLKFTSENVKTEKQDMINVFKNASEEEILKLERSMFIYEAGVKFDANGLKVDNILTSQAANMDLKSKKILIFHTHSQETFKDSTSAEEDGIVMAGEMLAKELTEKYGLNVIHYSGKHDVVDGRLERNGSYERTEAALLQILENDPEIEILIDLHRDGVPETRRLVTEIDGKQMAQIMFVNGISQLYEKGEMKPIDSLPNPYIQDNLNLSINLHLAAEKLYPGLSRRILIKPYRYSLHLKPNSLLIELGAQNNTLEEIKNTIEPLAEIIYNGMFMAKE